MKRPALALVVGVGVLLLLAYPALDMKTGVSGVNTFPNDFESKQGFAVLEQQFSAGGVNPVEIVVDGQVNDPGRPGGHDAPHAGAGRATRRSAPSRARRRSPATSRCSPCR